MAARDGGGGDPREDDRRTLDELRRHGADMASPFDVEHFLIFPGKGAARSAARLLNSREGWTATAEKMPRGYPGWAVVASHRSLLSVDCLQELRAHVTSVATQFGGDYDGWGAPVNVGD